jgi:uncharacterized membrane protein
MIRYLKIIAVVLALIGLVDAAYLTVHHYTAEPVPCDLTNGCEQVLTSEYAEAFGLPLAGFGAAAYFVAFALALLAVYGNDLAWKLYGAQAVIMAMFSVYLIYVQGYLIGAFCQFCLLSALTSVSLFVVFLLSLFASRRSAPALD